MAMKFLNKKARLQGYIRLMNHPGTPQYVARGVAIGLFCAFVVPLFQMALAFFLALGLKGARFSALLFTWVSNPFTIPFIYPLQCFVGNYLLGNPLSYHRVNLLLADLIRDHSVEVFLNLEKELLCSFFVGGLALGLLIAPLGYFIFLGIVVRFKRDRLQLKMWRRKKLAQQKKEEHFRKKDHSL
jgi:uncharacterized protein (DUF2062 family)